MGCVAVGPPALGLKREQFSSQRHWHGCGQRGVMPASKKNFSRVKYLVMREGRKGSASKPFQLHVVRTDQE
jgi:hypothetical protein